MKQARSSPRRPAARSIAGATAPRAERLGPGQRRHRRIARGIGVHEQDQPHGGRLRHSRQQPLGERGAGADHRCDIGMAQQVGEVVAGAGGVGRDGDAAGHQDREVGHAPFRAVLRQDQHTLARRYAQGREAACQELRLVPGAPPAPGPIDAVALGPQERSLVALRGRPLEHGHEIGAEIGRGHRSFRLPRIGAGLGPPRGAAGAVRAMLEARPQWPISRGLRKQRKRDGDARAGAATDEVERGICRQPRAGRAGSGLEPWRPLSRGRRSAYRDRPRGDRP